MNSAREWGEEEKIWLLDNLEYIPETGNLVWVKSVSARVAVGDVAGTYVSGYRRIKRKKRGKSLNYRAHRVVWFFHYGWVPPMLDHINGDRSDNRIENLRVTTPSLNIRNQKPRGSSKYKGVNLISRNSYSAIGRKCGESIYLGSSKSESEAAIMYDLWVEANLSPLERQFSKTNKELGLL
tara:strand:- start:83 stop:625 length:543 start_codon:yes stop_codon:yes gene_type:complete